MLQFVKIWAGTLFPLGLIIIFFAALLDSKYGDLSWERPVAYVWGATWHLAGMYVLTRMIYNSVKASGKAPLLLLSFDYQKALFYLTYIALAGYALGVIWPMLFGWINQDLIFALFIATTLVSSAVNFVLLFGWFGGWIDEDADPVPFRPIWRWLIGRRGNDQQ